MNRPLYFRAWDGKQMHRVGQINWPFRSDEPTAIQAGNRPWNSGQPWEPIDNPELMQFTGLQDMDGKDIFEHDWLAYIGPSGKEIPTNSKLVVWTEQAGFNLKSGKNFRIVGNLHEGKTE